MYRVKFDISTQVNLRELERSLDRVVAPIMEDSLNLLKQYAVQNLSGVPYTYEGASYTIQKRSGMGAASVQIQYPYGSPFKGRVFASAMTRYDGNPEQYNYLGILEFGRGEVKPKYTPAMKAGHPERARLAIPVGPHELISGQRGFRGITGKYRFVKSLPPMEGKHWMAAAAEAAKPEFPNILATHLNQALNASH